MGDAVQRLPPSVARLRICCEPNHQSRFSSAGYSPPSFPSNVVRVTAAPMCPPSGVAYSPSSRTPSSEMIAGKRLKRLLISRPTSVLPAKKRASGFGELSKQLG